MDNGTTNIPTVATEGFTGETNNLTLTGSGCPYGGTEPMIQFLESSPDVQVNVSDESCGASGIEAVLYTPTSVVLTAFPSDGAVYQTVVLTNATSSTMTIDSQGATAPFLWGGCPSTLAPWSSCVTSVGFDFTDYGAGERFTGSLTITTSDGTESTSLSATVK